MLSAFEGRVLHQPDVAGSYLGGVWCVQMWWYWGVKRFCPSLYLSCGPQWACSYERRDNSSPMQECGTIVLLPALLVVLLLLLLSGRCLVCLYPWHAVKKQLLCSRHSSPLLLCGQAAGSAACAGLFVGSCGCWY